MLSAKFFSSAPARLTSYSVYTEWIEEKWKRERFVRKANKCGYSGRGRTWGPWVSTSSPMYKQLLILSMQRCLRAAFKSKLPLFQLPLIEICYKYRLYNTDPMYKLLSSKEKLFWRKGGTGWTQCVVKAKWFYWHFKIAFSAGLYQLWLYITTLVMY